MKITLTLLMFIAVLSSSISHAVTMSVGNLSDLARHYRLVLLNGDALPKETLTTLTANNNAINERQIVWFWREKNQIKTNLFGSLSELSKQQISQHLAKYNVILIGKDGGTKLEKREFALTLILQLIDKMPMRQQEILEKN